MSARPHTVNCSGVLIRLTDAAAENGRKFKDDSGLAQASGSAGAALGGQTEVLEAPLSARHERKVWGRRRWRVIVGDRLRVLPLGKKNVSKLRKFLTSSLETATRSTLRVAPSGGGRKFFAVVAASNTKKLLERA